MFFILQTDDLLSMFAIKLNSCLQELRVVVTKTAYLRSGLDIDLAPPDRAVQV